jgi:hypothetical protein
MKFILLLFIFLNMLVYFWANLMQANDVGNNLEVPLYNQAKLEILHVIANNKINSASPIKNKQKRVVKQGSKLCLSIGDYEKDKAVIVSDSLVGLSEYLFIMPNDTVVKERYWLFSPAEKKWEDSVNNATSIRSKGISDIWLIPKGKDKGKVSLGLYSRQSKAEQKLEELTAMQINVELSNLTEKRYSIRLENIIEPKDIFKQLNLRFEDSEPNIQKINC